MNDAPFYLNAKITSEITGVTLSVVINNRPNVTQFAHGQKVKRDRLTSTFHITLQEDCIVRTLVAVKSSGLDYKRLATAGNCSKVP